MLAYTNRFLAIASLVRNLHSSYQSTRKPTLLAQIKNLKLRLRLIRDMQICGSASFTLCVLSLIGIFIKSEQLATCSFGLSLFSMLASLILSLIEIHFSVGALNIHLQDLSDHPIKKEIDDKQAN
jgi:hypothetical protein